MVYITFAGPNLERELEIEAIADSLGMNFSQQDIEWCKRLLEEASIAAEKSLKERYPRDRSAPRDGT